MIVSNVGDHGGNWHAALADALAANGVLEFPEGVDTTSQPFIITTRIEVRGVGWTSQSSTLSRAPRTPRARERHRERGLRGTLDVNGAVAQLHP